MGLILTATASVAADGRMAERNETLMEAVGPLAPLKGVMLKTKQQHGPVVLIVPGSGPTDRDGNSPLGLKASTYRLLAQGLAAQGIATVRIDKRGMFESAKAVADPNNVTIQDYADDVSSWVKTIRQESDYACVWVLGHSEGGLVALVAGLQNTDICGLILAATPGRPLGLILREQLRGNPANALIIDQALAAIDALESNRRVDPLTLHPALRRLFSLDVQGFLINTFALDPVHLIAGYKKPILIVQGLRDLQVSALDAQRLSQAATRSTLILLRDTNHVLKCVAADDRTANLATYGDPLQPLAPGIVDVIAHFISASTVTRSECSDH